MPTGPNWKLEDDLQTVTVTLSTNPPVVLKLDTAAVDSMLANLGVLRARMNPTVPKEFAMGQKVAAIADPAWATEPEAMAGNSLLHVRDPRFGWLHYVLSKKMAARLAALLQRQAEAPPPVHEPGKPN